MTDKRYLFRGFHPDENGKTTITLNGEKIRGEWLYWNALGMLAEPRTKTVPLTNVRFLKGNFIEFDTVGQWVTTDKNGNDLFEGDKVKSKWYGVGEVCFGEFAFSHCDEYQCNHYGVYAKCKLKDKYTQDDGYALIPSEVDFDEIELIGNKWEVCE